MSIKTLVSVAVTLCIWVYLSVYETQVTSREKLFVKFSENKYISMVEGISFMSFSNGVLPLEENAEVWRAALFLSSAQQAASLLGGGGGFLCEGIGSHCKNRRCVGQTFLSVDCDSLL